jgi:hypothetical protein
MCGSLDDERIRLCSCCCPELAVRHAAGAGLKFSMGMAEARCPTRKYEQERLKNLMSKSGARDAA